MSDIVCVQCKYIGKPKMKKRGSAKLDFFGWAVFPLGLPYTIWRMLARTPVCKACGSGALLPADGVAGQRLIRIAIGERDDDTPVVPPPLAKEPVLTKHRLAAQSQAAAQPEPVREPVPQPVYEPVPEPVAQPIYESRAPRPAPPPEPVPEPVSQLVYETIPEPLAAPPPEPPPPPAQEAQSGARKERLDPNVW